MTASTRNQPAISRLDGVDFIRGLALLTVVLQHINIFAGLEDTKVGAALPEWLWYVTFNSGLCGVAAFFAVSGFVITLTSIRRFGSLDRVSIGKFYWMRFARIAPPLLLVLLVLSTLHVANVDGFRIDPAVSGLPRAVLAVLAFHVNWFESAHGWLPACWTVFWTLSVEGLFYLVYPVACALLRWGRWGKLFFFSLVVFLIIAGPVARAGITNHIWQQQSYLANLDGIALGCLVGIATNWSASRTKFTESRWPLIAQLSGMFVLVLAALGPWLHMVARFDWSIVGFRMDITASLLGTTLFLWGSYLGKRKSRVIGQPIRWFGRHSYEIYLSHEFIIMAVLPSALEKWLNLEVLWVGVIIGLAALTGYAFAKFFSEPINQRLRRRRHLQRESGTSRKRPNEAISGLGFSDGCS